MTILSLVTPVRWEKGVSRKVEAGREREGETISRNKTQSGHLGGSVG